MLGYADDFRAMVLVTLDGDSAVVVATADPETRPRSAANRARVVVRAIGWSEAGARRTIPRMRARGLILQASYRIHDGAPVVHLYGRLENGATFLVRDHRQRPHFYIGAADVAKARTVATLEPVPTDRHNFAR